VDCYYITNHCGLLQDRVQWKSISTTHTHHPSSLSAGSLWFKRTNHCSHNSYPDNTSFGILSWTQSRPTYCENGPCFIGLGLWIAWLVSSQISKLILVYVFWIEANWPNHATDPTPLWGFKMPQLQLHGPLRIFNYWKSTFETQTKFK